MYDPFNYKLNLLRSTYKDLQRLRAEKSEKWDYLKVNNPRMGMDEIKKCTNVLSNLQKEIEAVKRSFKKDREDFIAAFEHDNQHHTVINNLKNLEL